MSCLYIFRGLPSSRKSSIARDMQCTFGGRIVERDAIRFMLYGTYHDPDLIDELLVTETQNVLIEAGLRMGEDVYVPDMNLKNQYVVKLIRQAEAFGAEWEIVDLTNADIDQVLWDNQSAERFRVGKVVPEKLIMDLHQRFIKGREHPLPVTLPERKEATKRAPYIPDTTKPAAIIVDIDGTVARMKDRGPFDEHLVSQDELIEGVATMVKGIAFGGVQIVFMSGRTDACRGDTERWLMEKMPWLEHVPGRKLHMRRSVEDRGRPDDDVKYDLFMREVAPHYNVLYTIDDRDKVVKMWRDIGLTCAQVAEGNF